MKCPFCNGKTKTTNSRPDKKMRRRRHECLVCHEKFTTYEMLADEYLEMKTGKKFKHELIVTVGDFLDLIDCDRESEEIVEIGDCNGGASASIQVCSEIWSAELEGRTINSIGINDGNYRIWLNDKEESK